MFAEALLPQTGVVVARLAVAIEELRGGHAHPEGLEQRRTIGRVQEGNGSVALSGTPVSPNGVTVAAEAAFMVTAVAAAAVVAKNARLFIVTSLTLRNFGRR